MRPSILLLLLSQWTGPGLGTQGGNLSSTAPLQLLESGVKRGAVSELNFTGSGVTSCTRSGNRGTCTIAGGGGGGAPTNATYITQTPDVTLTNEQAISSLATGLMSVTTGTGVVSGYAGTSCTNQFPRSLNGAGAASCASVSLTADVTGTLGQGNGGLGVASLTCGAGAYVTCNGTVCSCSTPGGGGGGTSPLILTFGGF